MSEKISGYLLLFIGLIIMLGSGANVYSVFTRRNPPIQLFDFSGIKIDTAQLIGGLPAGMALPENTSATEIIPKDLINQTSNYFAHLLLMGFIAGLGFNCARLGTYLVRPIVVKVKGIEEKKIERL